MRAEIINPFLNATINLFRQMFGLDVDHGQPHLVDNFGNHRWEVSGIISFSGHTIGVVVIRLPQLLADRLLKLTGFTFSDEQERARMLYEMVGELSNIIAGNAAGPLAEKGIDLEISTPVVIQGKNHRVHWPQQAPIIGLPFHTKAGPFTVNVSMKNVCVI